MQSQETWVKKHQIPILEKEIYSPPNIVCEILGDVSWGKKQGRLQAFNHPRNVCQKPIELHCNRHTSRGLWKQPGPRIRVHDHSLIFSTKYWHHLSQKLSERLVPNLSNFSPSLFKYSLTLGHFWQREWFLEQVLTFRSGSSESCESGDVTSIYAAANLDGYGFAGNNC